MIGNIKILTRLFAVFMLFLVFNPVTGQEKYRGFQPYFPARGADTTNGVIIRNAGAGYAGFYAVKGSDTLRLHYDNDTKAVLKDLDSLYLAGFNLFYLNNNDDTLFINNDTIVSAAGVVSPWEKSGNWVQLVNIGDSVRIRNNTIHSWPFYVEGKSYFNGNFQVNGLITGSTGLYIGDGDTKVVQPAGADDSLYIYVHNRELMKFCKDSTIRMTIKADKIAEAPYFLAWDDASRAIYAMDTTGWGGAGGSGGYWTLSGNALYPDNTTDSVAIGTSTVLAPLTVAGHVSFTGEGVIRTPDNGGNPAANIYIHGGDGDPDGGVFLNIDEGDDIKGEVFLGKVDSDEDSDSILVLGSNNAIGQTPKLWELNGTDLYPRSTSYEVGIGTNTVESGAILDVSGDVYIDNYLLFRDEDGVFSAFIVLDTTANGEKIDFNITPIDGNAYMTIDTFGLVGINNGNPSERLDVSGDVNVSDTLFADYIQVEREINYVNTYWEDLRFPVSAVIKGPSNNPGLSTFKNGTLVYLFDPDSDEELFFVAQLPHSYKLGTELEPHVHWSPAVQDTGKVVWGLEYTIANINDVFGATSTITATDSTDNTAFKHLLADFNGISGAGIDGVSTIIVCRIYRDANAAADTYPRDAAMLEIDIHFEIDSPGSRDETAK